MKEYSSIRIPKHSLDLLRQRACGAPLRTYIMWASAVADAAERNDVEALRELLAQRPRSYHERENT